MGILETLIRLIEGERDLQRRARIIKEQLRSDVNDIRKLLKDDAIGAFKAWSDNRTLAVYHVYSRTGFDEKLTSRLADIGDEHLVSDIIAFYSKLQRSDRAGQDLQAQGFNRRKLADYVRLLADGWFASVELDSSLANALGQVTEVRTDEADEFEATLILVTLGGEGSEGEPLPDFVS